MDVHWLVPTRRHNDIAGEPSSVHRGDLAPTQIVKHYSINFACLRARSKGGPDAFDRLPVLVGENAAAKVCDPFSARLYFQEYLAKLPRDRTCAWDISLSRPATTVRRGR
jgi:hypothetical protein